MGMESWKNPINKYILGVGRTIKGMDGERSMIPWVDWCRMGNSLMDA